MARPIPVAMLVFAAVGLHAQVATAASYTTYGGYTSDARPIVLRIADDGRQVVLARTAIDVACSDDTTDLLPDVIDHVPLSKSGKFSAGFSNYASTDGQGRPTVSSALTEGKVDRKRRRITGTWFVEVATAMPDGSRQTCRTERIKFTATAKPARGPAVAGFYGGISRSDDPLVLEAAKDGRSIRSAAGMFTLECGGDMYRFVADYWSKLPLSKSGKFAGKVTDYELKFADNSTVLVNASISGAIDRSGRKLSGKWRVVWNDKAADGSTVTCDSGIVKFSFKR